MAKKRITEDIQHFNLYITLEENSDEYIFNGTIDPYHKGQDGLFCYISISTEITNYIKQFQRDRKRFPIVQKMTITFEKKSYTTNWAQIIDIGQFQSHNENAIWHNPEKMTLNILFLYDYKLLNLCDRRKELQRHLKQVKEEKKRPKRYRFIDLRG